MFTKNKLAYLGLFYCSFIWGSTFIVTKDALNFVNPIAMVAFRFLISAFFLLPFVLRIKPFFSHIKEGFILSLFLSTLYITQTIGLLYTSASSSGFITGLFIIFIPIFLFFIKKRKINNIEIASSFIAILGLWFLTGGFNKLNLGDFLTLIAAMSYALHLIFTDKYVKSNFNLYSLIFHQFWIVSFISFFISFILNISFKVKTSNAWLIIFFLAIFPTLSAFFVQMKVQKKLEPFKVGLVFTLEPLFAAIFAWTVGGEKFFILKAIGGFLIFSALIFSEIGKIKIKDK